MSTELANLSNLPAHLRTTEETNEFASGISSGGLDMPVLSIRGKEFRIRYQGNEQSTRSREIKGVLIAARPHVSKRWYKGAYEAGSIDMPACFSIDGVRPSEMSTDKQSDKCSTCPRNQFGSKITPSGKQGKECSDYKRTIFLPIFDGAFLKDPDGNLMPCVLDIPWSSLKKNRADRSDNMFLAEYGGALSRHKIKVHGVVTRLEFTDAEYPQVCFAYDSPLDEQTFAAIEALRSDDTVAEALAEPNAEAPGPITETPPVEAPKAAEPAKPNFLGGQTKAEARDQPKAEPEPVKQEAAPEPEPEAAPANDDVMASVKKLLGGL